MKLLSAGSAGFLISMPGALVDAKKHVYDHRTGADFGVEKRDCGEFSEVPSLQFIFPPRQINAAFFHLFVVCKHPTHSMFG